MSCNVIVEQASTTEKAMPNQDAASSYPGPRKPEIKSPRELTGRTPLPKPPSLNQYQQPCPCPSSSSPLPRITKRTVSFSTVPLPQDLPAPPRPYDACPTPFVTRTTFPPFAQAQAQAQAVSEATSRALGSGGASGSSSLYGTGRRGRRRNRFMESDVSEAGYRASREEESVVRRCGKGKWWLRVVAAVLVAVAAVVSAVKWCTLGKLAWAIGLVVELGIVGCAVGITIQRMRDAPGAFEGLVVGG